jgi:inner membrane protein
MPSSIGHSLAGYIVYGITTRPKGVQQWQFLALCLLAANAPDLDFLPGFFVGDPNRYHHGFSHSIGFSVLFASFLSILIVLLKMRGFWPNFPIFLTLSTSHLFLDYLTKDTSFPYGLPLLWPFSNKYYMASFAFLPYIQRVSSSSVDFIRSLFSFHNFCAVTIEFLIFFPLVVLVSVLRK